MMALTPVDDSPGDSEGKNLFRELNQLIAEDGLWWMGFNLEGLWTYERGRAGYEDLFDFLASNKAWIGETLKVTLKGEAGKGLFSYGAAYAFDRFVRFLESIFDEAEFDALLLSHPGPSEGVSDLVRSWTFVARRCAGVGVRHAWDYFKGWLGTRVRRREFLLRRDRWNSLIAAGCNESQPYTILCVADLFREVFDGAELKALSIDTVKEVMEQYAYSRGATLTWVMELMRAEELDETETTSLLSTTDRWDEYCLLHFLPWDPPPPPLISNLQQCILTGRLPSDVILPRTRGLYVSLSRSCLRTSSWTGVDVHFDAGVESEFESIRREILRKSFSIEFQAEESCRSLQVEDRLRRKRESLHELQWKTFFVLLKRQLSLEERFLGRDEMLRRLRKEWHEMFENFTVLFTEGVGGGGTGELLVVLTFAVLSLALTKEEVNEILTSEDENGMNSFQTALDLKCDPRAFLALYDVARWSMLEGALCEIHAMGVSAYSDNTLIQILLEEQRKGRFN